MNILKDPRFMAAIIGLVASLIAYKLPSLDASTGTQIATGIVTFVVGLIIPAPGTSKKIEEASAGK